MTKRISGMSFDVYVDGDLIHIEKISLDITDNSAAAQTRGVPDGYVDGDVAAEGEIEVSSKVLQVLTAKARSAGSWRGIPPVDFLFYAKAGSEEMKVETFGNKLQLNSVLDGDPKGWQRIHAQNQILRDQSEVRQHQRGAVSGSGSHGKPDWIRGSRDAGV